MTLRKKQGTGRSLVEFHYWFSAVWVSWDHFLTSLALLERHCGWTVCLGWEITSKLVPLLIISAKKLKFRLYKGKTTLAPLEALIGEQYKEMPDVPWRFPWKLLDILRDSNIIFHWRIFFNTVCSTWNPLQSVWIPQIVVIIPECCVPGSHWLSDIYILAVTKRRLKLKLQGYKFVSLYDWVNTFFLSYFCHFSRLPAFFFFYL